MWGARAKAPDCAEQAESVLPRCGTPLSEERCETTRFCSALVRAARARGPHCSRYALFVSRCPPNPFSTSFASMPRPLVLVLCCLAALCSLGAAQQQPAPITELPAFTTVQSEAGGGCGGSPRARSRAGCVCCSLGRRRAAGGALIEAIRLRTGNALLSNCLHHTRSHACTTHTHALHSLPPPHAACLPVNVLVSPYENMPSCAPSYGFQVEAEPAVVAAINANVSDGVLSVVTNASFTTQQLVKVGARVAVGRLEEPAEERAGRTAGRPALKLPSPRRW